jgi:hypothetical protein
MIAISSARGKCRKRSSLPSIHAPSHTVCMHRVRTTSIFQNERAEAVLDLAIVNETAFMSPRLKWAAANISRSRRKHRPQ